MPTQEFDPERLDPRDFIFLEGKDGKEGHPDLWVAKYRLSASPEIQVVGRSLGLTLEDTAQEKNGRGYLGNVNQEQAVKLNLSLGGRTLNVGTARELFGALLSEKVFDGNGDKIPKREQSRIMNEITAVREPYRAEWYEDTFSNEDGELVVNRNYALQNGVLVPTYSEQLESCLMESRTPGISLKDWVKKATSQGFPGKNVRKGALYFWPPTNGAGAGFNANSYWAYLGGDWGPTGSSPALGVRCVRRFEPRSGTTENLGGKT